VHYIREKIKRHTGGAGGEEETAKMDQNQGESNGESDGKRDTGDVLAGTISPKKEGSIFKPGPSNKKR